jgi:excinuclease UvrABC ATPase subunit
MAQGTPADVARVKDSYTGQYLRELLGVVPEARREAGGGVATLFSAQGLLSQLCSANVLTPF